jgi:hypothetical protein
VVEIDQQNYFTTSVVFLREMRRPYEQVQLTTDNISAKWKADSVHVIDYLAKRKLYARLPVNAHSNV